MFIPPPHVAQAPIDMEQALAALDGNKALLATVLQMVIDQSAVEMAVIRSDVAANNTTALAASSHRLKGSLAAIAAQPAHQACSALNKLARVGDAPSFALGLTELEMEVDRLLPFVQTWLTQDKNQGVGDGNS